MEYQNIPFKSLITQLVALNRKELLLSLDSKDQGDLNAEYKLLEEFLMLYEKHNTYKDQKPSLNSNVLNDSRATMYKTSENFVNKYFATYKFVEKMMYMYESILELRKISSVDIIDIKREMIIPDGKRVIEVGGRSKKSRKSRKSRR